MATTWQYRPGFGWVERDATDEHCPVTGIRHADTAAWIEDAVCRMCGQSLETVRTLAVTP